MEMYCVKCRTKRIDPLAEAVTMKNGKPAMKGKCPTCRTGMYKIGNLFSPTNQESRLLKLEQEENKQMLVAVLASKL